MPALIPPPTRRTVMVPAENLGDYRYKEIHHEGERMVVDHVVLTTAALFPGGPRVPVVHVVGMHRQTRYAEPGTLIRVTV